MSRLHSQLLGPDGAPVVVLLHSLATSSDLWSPQLAVWRCSLRLLLIDLPGHGASAPLPGGGSMAGYAAAVAAELDRHGVEQAALLGLSLGSMVAQAFALAYPARCRALVLAHGAAATSSALRDVWQERIAAFREGGNASVVPATLARWFTPRFVRNAPLTMAWIQDMITATSAQGYVDAIQAIQALDHSDRLAAISCPTLVIAGEHDAALPPAAGQAIATAIPHARFALLEGAAHLGNVEQPTAFTELAGDFLHSVLLPGVHAPPGPQA